MNRIKEILFYKEKTQTWLAGELGISVNQVNNYCQNKNQPKTKDLPRIAKVLGVEIKDLFR